MAIELTQPLLEGTLWVSCEKFVTSSQVIPPTKNLMAWHADESSVVEGSFGHFREVEDVKEFTVPSPSLDARFQVKNVPCHETWKVQEAEYFHFRSKNNIG